MSTEDALALLNQMTHETQDGTSPLRHFFGKLEMIQPTQKQQPSNDGTVRNVLELKYQFSEVEVISSITPYMYPTAELPFFSNDPSQAAQPTSRLGIWLESIGDILGIKSKLPDAIGKRLEVKWGDGHPMKRMVSQGVFEDYDGTAFAVVSIDGKGVEGAVAIAPVAVGVSAVPQQAPLQTQTMDDVLADLADGQNHPAFIGRIAASDAVKADEMLFSSILADNGAAVINNLLALGKIANNEGVYSKVG